MGKRVAPHRAEGFEALERENRTELGAPIGGAGRREWNSQLTADAETGRRLVISSCNDVHSSR